MDLHAIRGDDEFWPRWICFVEGEPDPEPAAVEEPAADPVEDPPAPAPEPDPVEDPPTDPPPPVAKPTDDWKDRRIAQLTARLRAAQAKTPEIVPPPTPTTSAPESDFDARVNAEAARRAESAAFAQACERVRSEGDATFPDFGSRVESLAQLVDGSDPASVSTYSSFIAAAIETGEGPKLIHALGGDLNEASRILALSPTKMAVELTKLALRAEPTAEPSKLPKPITPVGSRGATHEAIDPRDAERADRLSTREWMARREAQVRGPETRH